MLNVNKKVTKDSEHFRSACLNLFVFDTEQQYIVLDKTGPEKKYTHF